MAWGYHAASYANNGIGFLQGAGGSQNFAFGSAITAGDLIVVGLIGLPTSGGAAPTFSVSDTVNGAWSAATNEVVTLLFTVGSANCRASIWAFPNSAVGSVGQNCGVGVVTSGSAVNLGAHLALFNGIVTSSPLDTKSTNSGTGANPSSGAVSPATSSANELMVGIYGDLGENTTLSVGNINGSAATLAGKHDADSGKWQGLFEYGDSGSSGGSPTATITGVANGGWAMLSAVFKITGGGAAVIPPGIGPAQSMPQWMFLDTAMTR